MSGQVVAMLPGAKAELQIYDNRTFQEGNFLLSDSKSNPFSYIDVGYPDFIRLTDRNLVSHQANRLKCMLPQMELLSGKERNIYHFFNQLQARIETRFAAMKQAFS
ncbi:MAG: hypothetical protein SFV22_05425 [Saprospiraceae bacterium]|nr:hypothetical protein [Saprospiraceae bacterium]